MYYHTAQKGGLQQVALPSESTIGRETNYHPAIKLSSLYYCSNKHYEEL